MEFVSKHGDERTALHRVLREPSPRLASDCCLGKLGT